MLTRPQRYLKGKEDTINQTIPNAQYEKDNSDIWSNPEGKRIESHWRQIQSIYKNINNQN